MLGADDLPESTEELRQLVLKQRASIYSLIETCKLNGVNPEAYPRHVLSVIADHPINRFAELLPWNLRDRLAPDAPSAT